MNKELEKHLIADFANSQRDLFPDLDFIDLIALVKATYNKSIDLGVVWICPNCGREELVSYSEVAFSGNPLCTCSDKIGLINGEYEMEMV